ncbi:hypothetical protein ACED56_12290 [Vibrio splendidus]|uniref:hypothetical protein n=1 Tax=Vibrio TaxID=662 RepID=UPI00352DAAFA
MNTVYNPATELLGLINKIIVPKYSNTKARVIWLAVLNLENEHITRLYEELSNITKLPNEIRFKLEELNFPTETIEQSLGKVDHLFKTMDFNTPGSIFAQHLSDDVQNHLKQVIWYINHPSISSFSPDEISTLGELNEQLKSLFEAISGVEDISPDLKVFLDVYIAELISGIEAYLKDHDIQSLKRAATSAITVLGLEKEILEAAQDTEFGIQFRTILLSVMEFIGYGNELKQLSDNIQLLSSAVN